MIQLPLLATLLATLTVQETPAPVPRVEIGATSRKQFRFDWDGTSTDGQPHTVPIVSVIFRYTNPDIPTQQRWVTVDDGVMPGETKIPVRDALKGVPAGNWDLSVKLLDAAGQEGVYSVVTDETRLLVRRKSPSTLKNVGVVDS